MGADTTYPVTIGQLSVWRDLEKMPPERHWEANLPLVWDIPGGHTAEEVWAALGELAMRHESLRTTYVVEPGADPRQHVTAHDPVTALDTVRQGIADVAERGALEDAEYRHSIDVTSEMPWRVWLLTADDVPAHLVVTVNHMAADGVAALMLEEDLRNILAGIPMPAAPTTRELALRQHGDGRARLRAAERYWHRTLESAPRRAVGAASGPWIGATLHTGIPLPMLHDGAGKLDVSAATVVLATYYRGLRKVTGNSKMLIYAMSNNRFEAETARLVTSLVQWVPIVLEFEETATFEEIATKVHWKSFNALKYAICDPDAIVRTREEFANLDPPADPGFNYNPMIAPPGFPSTDTLQPHSIEWYEPARATGPGVYLIIRGLSSIDMVARVHREGFDKDALNACLESIQDDMLHVIGMAGGHATVSPAG